MNNNSMTQIQALLAAMNVHEDRSNNTFRPDKNNGQPPLSQATSSSSSSSSPLQQQHQHDVVDNDHEEKLSQLADLIRTTLGVSYKDNSAYLEIAKQMTKFSLKSPDHGSSTAGGGGGGFGNDKEQDDDHGNNSGGRRSMSPPSSSYQPPQRGRSPARSVIASGSGGGGGTADTAKTRSSSTQSAARNHHHNKTFTMPHQQQQHSISSSSPLRRQNSDSTPTAPKIPLRQEYPSSAGSSQPQQQANTTPRKNSPPRYPTTTGGGSSSTHEYLKGENGFKAAAASPDEKKESEPSSSSSAKQQQPQLYQRRFQQRDVSTGSSPPRSVSPTRYNNIQHTPSTPQQQQQQHHDRSGSRSMSPFAARPGLQEGGDSDSVSLCGRSPGRSYNSSSNNSTSSSTVINTTTTAASIPTSIPHIPNMSSGMSSTTTTLPPPHHHPSGVPHHNRSRSQGVDVESIAKPHKPRPHSQSPMRNQKPSSTDDQGDLPIAQPNRAFGLSPTQNYNNGGGGHYYPNNNNGGNHQATAYAAPFIQSSLSSSSDIQLPDFSKITIPDIGAHHNNNGSGGVDGDNGGGGLFTPPPRTSSNNNNNNGSSFVDDPMSAYPIGSSGLKPRSAFQVDELFGNGGGNSITNGRNPSPKFPLVDRSPSPMDMDIDDETPPLPPFSLGQQPPTSRFGRRPNPPRKTASSSSSAKLPPPTTTNPINSSSSIGNNHNLAFINAKREEARSFFGCKNYRSSIQAYTEALQRFNNEATTTELLLPRDTYAVLLSNRAACLLMVGAYDAAVADCTLALEHVKMPLPKQPFSNDGGYMLKVKLYTRLGRSYMKLGLHAESTRAFEDACQTADVASDFTRANHSKDECRQNLEFCLQIKTDAALGKSDAKRLKDACDNLTLSMQHILYGHAERTQYADALGHVNLALSMASGSVKLIESKLSILSYMKRWREVAGFCERLAACNVLQDGIFVDDLADYNPFPGVPPARYLKADFFKNTRDEDTTTRDLKLTSRAAAEAVIRLPMEIAPTYIRALRLEERYPAGDAAIQSLEELKTRQGVPVGWLGRERAKLALTKTRREEADELFRSQEFELASQKYMECLVIDRDGNGGNDPVDGLNAGGRLHAVLHCNLAACLMARGLHKEAVEECTNALRIHGRYMKAILRRARCYSRLQQSIESISEYRRWLNLVEDRSETSHNAACIFDGPQDVKDAEIAQVKEELDNVQKAKRRNEVKAKEEAERRRAQQRSNFQENFSTSWRSTSGTSAQQRRENFCANQQQLPDNNNWDSFSGRGGGGGSTARSNSNPRPRPHNNHPEGASFRSNSQGRASPRSTTDHYATLEIPRSASEEDIKKAYRRMALKYHPDKNKDSNAGDHFRRVKLAHDVLSDPVKRREYDGHRRPY